MYSASPSPSFRTAPAGAWIAAAFMVFTTCQALFLVPDCILVPGERTNLFTALLCALSLATAWFLTERPKAASIRLAAWITLMLTVVLTCSALASAEPQESLFRAFSLAASAAGGFWCGRTLCLYPGLLPWFIGSCCFLLAMAAGLGLTGAAIDDGFSEAHGIALLFNGSSLHALTNQLMLLCFAPLAVLFGIRRGRGDQVAGVLLVCLTGATILASGLRSALAVPMAAVLGPLGFGALRLRTWCLLLGLFVLAALAFVALFPQKWGEVLQKDREEIYYRVESYPFSLHVAAKHPWLGVGLRAPRTAFLDDYTLSYPHVTRQAFQESLENIVTAENIFLTMLTGAGLPFLLLYAASLLTVYVRLACCVVRRRARDGLPLLAIFLPLTAGLVYSLLYDSLLYPEVSWLFHLLAGLAAGSTTPCAPAAWEPASNATAARIGAPLIQPLNSR